MSIDTARLLYPSDALKLGADGYIPAMTTTAGDGCCPDPLCLDVCSSICSFIDLLPSGPMWDAQKDVARRSECDGDAGPDCPSMAQYAAYVAKVMHDHITTILWPAIREASPHTAVTTLDDWLDRYGWEDCFRTNCRTPYTALFSPYETPVACGTEYFPTQFSDAFECALKHGILQSLVRLSRGIVNNLDGINWVIEPLGAVLRPVSPWPDPVLAYLRGQCTSTEAPCWCDLVQLELCSNSATISGCPPLECGGFAVPIAALQNYTNGSGAVVQLYPAVIAAECIVRSIMPKNCPNIIFRCEV
jgi:hypothetical protein